MTKNEAVLGGDSVEYASSFMIADSLAYDFEQEKKRNYSGMNPQEIAYQVMRFISGI